MDAFFGGRCNVIKMTYDFAEDEKGKYVDFGSLYPTVNFWKPYLVGYPEKISNPKLLRELNKKWFGFVKCKVVAPRGLYLSVLPVRINAGTQKSCCFLCAENAKRLKTKESAITQLLNELSSALGVRTSCTRLWRKGIRS